jgi:hypothetical protein
MVVMCESRAWFELIEKIMMTGADCSKNGNVFSFGIDVGKGSPFQIDLIYVGNTHRELSIALTYFGFNDLGNLMGRIFHRAGFKYGHRGLLKVVRDPDNRDHIIDEVLVSEDPRKIFEFGGYDYDRYLDGFWTREEIFEYVASSPLFNRDIYLFENRNAKSRMRDKKRVMYNEFLNWCEKNDDLPSFWTEDKEEYRNEQLTNAFSHFPEFKRRYDDAITRLEHSKKLRSKFNGDIVRKITGLNGASLGIFIKEFKNRYGDLLDKSTKEEIEQFIEDEYERTNKEE